MTEERKTLEWVPSRGGWNGPHFRLKIGGDDLGHFYPHSAAHVDTDAAMAKIAEFYNGAEKLREVLRQVRDCVVKGGPGICDTVWFSEVETLVDHIDAVLEQGARE